MEQYDIPAWWSLSNQQDVVIGNLIDAKGEWITAYQFCDALYGEGDEKMVAPAKLRVLMQRCRDIVDELTQGRAQIITRRGSGWRIKLSDRTRLMTAVEPD
tara:strand:- start:24815 stop:25117 length:303 start_codon:yes stop_codon:yes gene_type:complete